MSGHSKWSKVKHQKATTDVVKARAFTNAARSISIAVSEGGGVTDPNHNFRLRLAIEKARQENVPKENIERAIEKGKGGGSAALSQLVYEAFGPSRVALLIEAVTDNSRRTVSQVKNYVENSGGIMTSQGAVSYLFAQSGYMLLASGNTAFDVLFEACVLAGATDITEDSAGVHIYCSVADLATLGRLVSQDLGMSILSQSIIMKPHTLMEVSAEHEEEITQFISGLLDMDDVIHVYSNMKRRQQGTQ